MTQGRAPSFVIKLQLDHEVGIFLSHYFLFPKRTFSYFNSYRASQAYICKSATKRREPPNTPRLDKTPIASERKKIVIILLILCSREAEFPLIIERRAKVRGVLYTDSNFTPELV